MAEPSTIAEALPIEDVADAYKRLRRPLIQLAYLLTFDAQEALDIVQECFAVAMPKWHTIEQPEAYLRRAVTNRSYNTTRDRRRRADKARRHAEGSDLPLEEKEYLADLIANLPPKERSMIVLRFYADQTTKEIADSLGVRQGSVGPTLTRALRRLEKALSR